MRPVVKKIVKEATLIKFMTITGGTVAGLFFASMTGLIAKIPGLLLVIPAFMNMRGEIFSSFGARLATKLHLGLVEPKYTPSRSVLVSALSYLALSSSRVLIITLLGYITSLLIGVQFDPLLILSLLFLALLISFAILLPLSYLADVFFFRRGYDPENMIGPLMMSFSDMISLYSIILSAFLMGV